MSLLNIIEEEYVVEKNPTGRGKTVDFMGVWNKTSQYDWTNEFYLSEYFGTSHSRSFQATRVQFFSSQSGFFNVGVVVVRGIRSIRVVG